MKKLNKLVAALMAIMMIVTMMPVSTFAIELPDNIAAITLITDTIKTTLVDGLEQKGSSKTFKVIARDKDGKKIDSTVTLNGGTVKANWIDTDKTSYTLNFTQKGENIVIVTASDAKIQYKIDYRPAKHGEIIGTATWSVEGFSIGKGYFVEPIEMNIYEGYNAAQHLEKLLTEHGLRFDYTGALDKAFYIAGLYDGEFDESQMWESNTGGYGISESAIITTPSAITTSPSAISFTLNDSDEPDLQLPAKVVNLLELNSVNIDLSSYGRDDSKGCYGLGEFDFTSGSGWMYAINNVFPNVGFADSYPADGDVFRVQFTMYYGSDIGGASAMGGGEGTPSVDGAIEVANKDMLTYAIAQEGYDNVSVNDKEAVLNIASTQSDVDNATKNIMGSSEGGASDKATSVLSELKSERLSSSKAKIEFNSDEEGTFYYAVVERDAANINVDTNGSGTAMVLTGNSFTIDNLDSQSAKDVYIVAKDKNKNISGAVRIPVKEYIDTYAPVLSGIISSRTGKETATVKFTTDEAGTYYYSVVEKDAEAPVVDTAGIGIVMVTGENKISISNLYSGTEKDVYVAAKDINGYVSLAYKITVDKYIDPNMAIVEKAMKHLDNTLAYMLKTVPAPVQETTAGDWAVMTLARAGYTVPEGYYEGWKNVADQLMIDKGGNLNSNKYTEYSRLMLPINALGYDPTDLGGYNVLTKYADLSKVSRQGVNGPIWALIALDTNNYLIDKDAVEAVTTIKNRNSRAKMIQYTLDKEIVAVDGTKGGFALTGKVPDPDMTAMAIQSFIPYYNGNDLLKAEFGVDLDGYNIMIADVKGFVDRGLDVLSKIQRAEGDYSSWGTVNSESTAQVLVALVGLGIDPMKDDRFIKNGKTLLDGIMKYAVEGGGFAHTYDASDTGLGNGGGTVNAMATDQSGYALVA
nr:DUF4430 domain-containing protein [uncultured Aminipila sp.]